MGARLYRIMMNQDTICADFRYKSRPAKLSLFRKNKLYRGMLLFVLVLLVLGTSAKAQTGAYIGFTPTSLDSHWIYGPTLGVYFNSHHHGPLTFGPDVRANFAAGSGSTNLENILVGPRLAVHSPGVPIKPYAELLIGLGHANVHSVSQTRFEYQLLGGVEYTIAPRVDWRVLELGYSKLVGFDGGLSPKSISTGLVFRLP